MKILLCLLLASLTAGCATMPGQLQKATPGMPRKEVEALIGKPTSEKMVGLRDVATYVVYTTFASEEQYVVYQDDKVVAVHDSEGLARMLDQSSIDSRVARIRVDKEKRAVLQAGIEKLAKKQTYFGVGSIECELDPEARGVPLSFESCEIVENGGEYSYPTAGLKLRTPAGNYVSIKVSAQPDSSPKDVIDRCLMNAKGMRVSKANLKAIKAGSVGIGFTRNEVIMAAGIPQKINRTVTGASVSEQWVYGSGYVYLEGGIVRSFQD